MKDHRLLVGQVAIITGSTEGIGFASARLLARHGARVYLNGRDPKKMRFALETLSAEGLDVKPLVGDAALESVAFESRTKVIKESGAVDILINAVGNYTHIAPEKLSLRNWEQLLSVNLTPAFLWAHEVIPIMKEKRRGRIINIASIAGLAGFREMEPYNAAKGGLIAYTKGLARDLIPYNVTANVIAPGPTLTEGLEREMQSDPGVRERLNAIRRQTLDGRLGEPDDVAKAALFFASTYGDFVTGQVVTVSGGYYL